MTGRAMGYCAGNDAPGFETAPGGRFAAGYGFGGGGFRGRGGWGRGDFGRGRRGPAFAGRMRGTWGFGRGAYFDGPYWNEDATRPEAREAMIREEIDLLSGRLDALKRELEASGAARPDTEEDA